MHCGRVWVVLVAACGRVGFAPSTDFDAAIDGAAAVDARDGNTADAPDAGIMSYRDVVFADSPRAYWRLSDNGAVGASAVDESGGYTGLYSGTCTPVAGLVANDTNGAIRFDGSSCRIDITGDLSFAGTSPFTIEAWVSLVTTDVYAPIVMTETRSGADPVDGYALTESPLGMKFERVVSMAQRSTPHYTMTPGEITHLVSTYDGATLVMFVNGVQFSMLPDPRALPGGAVTVIGGYPPGTGTPHPNGVLDEIAIYNGALAQSRIELHHDIGRNGPR